jgi:hypothetical protein
MPVAHAYNPSYSGGRDQEVHSCKPAWAKKYPTQNRAGGMAQVVVCLISK